VQAKERFRREKAIQVQLKEIENEELSRRLERRSIEVLEQRAEVECWKDKCYQAWVRESSLQKVIEDEKTEKIEILRQLLSARQLLASPISK